MPVAARTSAGRRGWTAPRIVSWGVVCASLFGFILTPFVLTQEPRSALDGPGPPADRSTNSNSSSSTGAGAWRPRRAVNTAPPVEKAAPPTQVLVSAPPAPAAAPAPTASAGAWRPRQTSGVRQVSGSEPAEGPTLTPPAVLATDEVPPRLPVFLPEPVTLQRAPEEAPPPRPVPTKQAPPLKPADEQERPILLGAARNAAGQKKWDLAVERYEAYFAKFGTDDTKVRREFAGVLLQAGRLRQGLREFGQLLTLLPEDLALRIAYADGAVQDGDFKLAITVLTPAFQQDANNVEVAVKLARAYVFDENLPRALGIVNQSLSRLRPGDPSVPRMLPALYLDLDQPMDTLAYLDPMLERRPIDPELLAIAIRAYSRLGDRSHTLELLTRLGQVKDPSVAKVRQELGDNLLAAQDFDLASVPYLQVLQADPGNIAALLGLARVHLQTYRPQAACKILQDLNPPEAFRRSYLSAKAEYHQLVGEYYDAKRLYEKLLHFNESDHELRIALGALYEQPLREDERAKAEYAKVPCGAAAYRRARLGIAAALTNQRHFNEAINVCKQVLVDNPADGNALALEARALGKANRPAEAVSLCVSFLDANSRNARAVLPVRLALGRVLLDAKRYPEALHEYEIVLTLAGGRTPSTFYGLSRAADKAGNKDRSRHALTQAAESNGGPARNLLMLVDLFSEDADDANALEITQVVLRDDPGNLAALIRLVAAQGRQARFSGKEREVVQTAQQILAVSPTNVRAGLELARGFGSAQKFGAAARAYEAVIALDATARVPRRERARVLYSNYDFAGSQAAYRELQTPLAEQQLAADLEALGRKDERARPLLTTLPFGDAPATTLQKELPRLENGDPEFALALRRIELDYQARNAEQMADRLEAEVQNNDWRPRAAIVVAKQLLDLEPNNTAALFDSGQDYGKLRQTGGALDSFSRGIEVDPHEREASIALERASLELMPRLQTSIDFFEQSGRDGLARITRLRYGIDAIFPYRDEDQFFSLGFARASYIPPDDRGLDGNILSGGFQAKFFDQLFIFGKANLESFENRLSNNRVTFDTGTRFDFNDMFRVKANLFLENVVENGETLRQDIYRYGARASLDYKISRRWATDATYTYAYYSDNNDLNEIFLRTDYVLFFPPTELKAVFSTDILGYRNQSVFPTFDPNYVFGTNHPYFTPKLFTYYEGRLEWKQWLSRDYFTYANQCWYALQYGIGWDNHLSNYHNLRATINYDVRPWLTVGVDGRFTISSVYDANGITAYVVFRCPKDFR